MPAAFQTGLDVLLANHRAWLTGKRVGLLAHPASVDARGVHASKRLRAALGNNLVALFGPEHGFYGAGGAGEIIGAAKHPEWGIPIHSLYGDHRRPTESMLRDIDVLIFDLQDIAVRCYTFVSTLRYVMEECARYGKTLIVCDRPIPFPNTVDGPMLNPPSRGLRGTSPKFESFVACVNVPLVYGMTPGETALYLKRDLDLSLNLRVSKMRGWRRVPRRPRFPWVPPSPGIRTWETAWTYPATVWAEATPAVNIGRGGPTPFQIVCAPWINSDKLVRTIRIPGASLQPISNGVRIVVTDPDRFQPVRAGLRILKALGPSAWKGARREWFHKLMGTDRPWTYDLRAFKRARKKFLLYPP